jgi:hypothetical protein
MAASTTWRSNAFVVGDHHPGHPGPRAHGRELHLIVDIGLVGTQPLRLKVPPVEPGEYRIAKEVTRERPAAQRQVTLSARLRVTG